MRHVLSTIRVGTVVLAMLTALVPARAQDKASPLPAQLPLGVDACFGRSYDAAHLAKNPRQRVTSFHLFHDLSPDSNSESLDTSADEMRENDGEHGSINVTAYVRLRDRKGVYSNGFSCQKRKDGTVQCAVDCDGGSFGLRAAGDALTVENRGFVVIGGCGGSDEEQSDPVFVKPGTDDKTFRLDKQPLAQCTALRDAQLPVWAKLGPPLRERLAKDGALCMTRSYDAKHLAAHPKQTVKRIAVLEAPSNGDRQASSVNFIFRTELRNGQKLQGRTSCWPDQYSYVCTHDEKVDERGSFHLTRAGADMMLRDRLGSLAALLKAKLGTDDRMFRLQPAPESACEF